MNNVEYNYRLILEGEFDGRKRRNPGYSLRAYARDLELPASKLSEILRGICGLSAQSATKLAKKLQLTPEESKYFIYAVEAQHARSKKSKIHARKMLSELKQSEDFDEISLERFRIISDWWHFAILELTELDDFSSSHEWIASRLGLSLQVVEDAIERLIDFGLLENISGKLIQTHINLATPSGIPSREIRKHHSQILMKAQESLAVCSIEERDFSAMTMVIDDEQMEEAKKLIKDFRRNFDRLMKQSSTKKKRVYTLAIQYFPLDIKENCNLQETKQ